MAAATQAFAGHESVASQFVRLGLPQPALNCAKVSSRSMPADRSMRRWAAGTDDVPDGVWLDIHHHAASRWTTIKYFDDEIAAVLKQKTQLRPVPNSKVLRAHLGLHFALHTENGRPVRCFIHREVFDDRVPRDPLSHTLNYFKDHADVFYRAAQRKFDAGDVAGDLISISNADVAGEDLPDTRSH